MGQVLENAEHYLGNDQPATETEVGAVSAGAVTSRIARFVALLRDRHSHRSIPRILESQTKDGGRVATVSGVEPMVPRPCVRKDGGTAERIPSCRNPKTPGQ
jgi:hypothetical protein